MDTETDTLDRDDENTASFAVTLSGDENAPGIEQIYPTDPNELRCIVCAWIIWRPVFGGKFAAEPRAVVFLNDGNGADLARARAYIASADHGRVFQFSMDDPNPLGSARALLLKAIGPVAGL